MTDSSRSSLRLDLHRLALPIAFALGVQPVPGIAQQGAIVQATPPAMAVDRLNQNLNRLSRQPQDMDALIGAGMASYELGDAQAANGFFTRADLVNSRDPRAKLGLALVALDLKDGRTAAENFDAAAALGGNTDAYLGKRAFAYDLVGQQDKAQRDYAQALRADPANRELIRRYAVSLAISGKLTEAEATMRPLLYQSDRAAWRDRTMILAMNGHTTEARRIAQTIMPKALADAMDPYLVRMGALSPAQKAAAVYFGQFPADGMRMAPVTSPQTQVAARDEEPRKRRHRRDERSGEAAVSTSASGDDSTLLAAMPHGDTPPPVPVRDANPVFGSSAMGAPIAATPRRPARPTADDDPDGWTAAERAIYARNQPSRTEPARPVAAPVAAPVSRPVIVAPVQTSAQATQPPQPSTQPNALPPAASSPVQPPVPARPAAPVQPPVAAQPAAPVQTVQSPPPAAPRMRSLAAIMADIQVPDAERTEAVEAADLKEVARMRAKVAADKAKKEAAAKAKAEAEAKAKEEAELKARIKANPSRNWVQIATGRDVNALVFDMRRLRKTYSSLADQDGWTAEWGQTRRLLVGPFASVAKAKAVETDLKKAGGDAFIWQSEAGEVVTALSRK